MKSSNTLTGKAGAMLRYLSNYPRLQSFLYTNTSDDVIGNTSFNTIYGETWEKRYLGGHGVKSFDFSVSVMLPQDAGTSDNNAEQLQVAQDFMDWIDEQEANKNYPDFENCKVLAIENLQNMPNFAGVNAAGNTAKYMFQCRVHYYE